MHDDDIEFWPGTTPWAYRRPLGRQRRPTKRIRQASARWFIQARRGSKQCPNCHGIGAVLGYDYGVAECPECGGEGWFRREMGCAQ